MKRKTKRRYCYLLEKKQMESIFVRLEILRLLAWENCHSDRIRNIRQSKNICR